MGWWWLAMLASPQIEQMPQPEERPPFSFLAYKAGEVLPDKLVKGCPGRKGAVECSNPLFKLSSTYASLIFTTNDYKLSTLYIIAHPNSYQIIVDAFQAKYGEPCRQMVAVWKNAAGAELENPSFEWCFESGTLALSKYGRRIDTMNIVYTDQNQPSTAPVVNF